MPKDNPAVSVKIGRNLRLTFEPGCAGAEELSR
jgi:hypothetical protein